MTINGLRTCARRPWLACSALLAILVACQPAARDGEPPALQACPSTIDLEGDAFVPDRCEVSIGTTITFVNRDAVPHTVTSEPQASMTFDSGMMGQGDSFDVTFDQLGEQPYFCEVHPHMRGRVVVVE